MTPNGQGGDGILTCEHCGAHLQAEQGGGSYCQTPGCTGNWSRGAEVGGDTPGRSSQGRPTASAADLSAEEEDE